MAMLINAVIRHEPTNDCWDWHCVIHDVDEVGDGYLRCGECGHLYLTARDLRRAYRKGYVETVRSGCAGTGGWMTPMRWWHVLTIRARRIFFCQECIHDF